MAWMSTLMAVVTVLSAATASSLRQAPHDHLRSTDQVVDRATTARVHGNVTENDIRFMLFTSASDSGARLRATDDSFSRSMFDSAADTAVIIDGWVPGGRHEDCWTNDLKDKLFAKKKYNVIIVDWVDANCINYFESAANAAFVAEELSKLLKSMKASSKGLDNSKLHFIGFSVGAHIAGMAGSCYGNVSRITGLDPAGPFFDSLGPELRLDSDDAEFVDVVHTDQSSFGYKGDCGDVDIYFNGGFSQPGAKKPEDFLQEALKFGGELAIGESHYRAVQYFLESVNSDSQAQVYQAACYEDFLRGDSFDSAYTFGLDMDTTARGKMFILTQAATSKGSGYLSNNYARVKVCTTTSQLYGTLVLKVRGLNYGKILTRELVAEEGIFSGDLYTVVNFPVGTNVLDLGFQAAYQTYFFDGESFLVNSVTLSQLDASQPQTGVYSHCNAVTVENTCTVECTYPLQLQAGAC